MANPSQPFGFQPIGMVDGFPPNFGLYTGQINPANTHSIYQWDVASVLAGGYYDYATEVGGGAPVGGIFDSFSWQSISYGGTYRSRAWLGNTADVVAGGTVSCKLIVANQARFRVRTNGANGVILAQANVGSNINFARGATPGNNQVSTYSADTADFGSGASYPFKIYDIETGQIASDATSLYNVIIVGFNSVVLP